MLSQTTFRLNNKAALRLRPGTGAARALTRGTNSRAVVCVVPRASLSRCGGSHVRTRLAAAACWPDASVQGLLRDAT